MNLGSKKNVSILTVSASSIRTINSCDSECFSPGFDNQLAGLPRVLDDVENRPLYISLLSVNEYLIMLPYDVVIGVRQHLQNGEPCASELDLHSGRVVQSSPDVDVHVCIVHEPVSNVVNDVDVRLEVSEYLILS